MTPYLQTQVAVYRHLLARNAQDENFNFSLRQSFRKSSTSTEGVFIGTEKSSYFGFTLWNVPVSYPGSSGDLLDYFIELNRDGSFRLYLQFFITKKVDTDQNRWSLAFADSLLAQQWSPQVRWDEDKPDNRMRKLIYLKGQKLYSSRIGLRIEDVKFEPHTGREFGAKLVESVKEIEDGGFKLALGAVKGGVDNFLTQKLPKAFNQV